jgi:hypothetical protein
VLSRFPFIEETILLIPFSLSLERIGFFLGLLFGDGHEFYLQAYLVIGLFGYQASCSACRTNEAIAFGSM